MKLYQAIQHAIDFNVPQNRGVYHDEMSGSVCAIGCLGLNENGVYDQCHRAIRESPLHITDYFSQLRDECDFPEEAEDAARRCHNLHDFFVALNDDGWTFAELRDLAKSLDV